jgi:hypothetical protein
MDGKTNEYSMYFWVLCVSPKLLIMGVCGVFSYTCIIMLCHTKLTLNLILSCPILIPLSYIRS